MADAMAGLAKYEGLPASDTANQGETHIVSVTFWGFLKMPPHSMFIETLDCAQRLIQSREHSRGITRWDHRLTIEPVGGQAKWLDEVVIDAGWRTSLVARFAAWMYARRHRLRAAASLTATISRN